MQDRPHLSKGKLIFLVVISAAAITMMMIAPDGAVGQMFDQFTGEERPVTGADNLTMFPPKSLPALSFMDERTKGKVVIANFWALWCGPCKSEKPKLDMLQRDYADKGLVVITIAEQGTDMDAIRQYYAEHNLPNLTPERDENGLTFATLGVRGIPTSIIINKKGQVVGRAEGPVGWGNIHVHKIIDDLLAEQ